MRHLHIALCTAVFLLMASPPAFSQMAGADQPQFFQALPDLPMMQGLEELPDQTVTFDKPEGRIIEFVAHIQGVSEAEVRAYYAAMLPQFGWSGVGGNTYDRSDEHLQMSFETLEGQHFLRIMVAPQ